MQIIKLDIEHFNFYCPVTGTKISGSDADDHSAALVLSVCETGHIMHSSDNINKQLNELGISPDSDSIENTEIEQLKFPPGTVCYQITVHGFSCGPASITADYFINMNYCEDHEWNYNL
tara:strand:- start:61 stop:417 length:357 start_codon:yes stop_codon:yes gene_type:complete